MKKCYLFFFIFLSATLAHAQVTRYVPSQYSTIQAALNACGNNDSVIVAPGVYYQNILWPAVKNIKLVSSGTSDNTIIDGAEAGSVITFNVIGTSYISNKTQIKGFTIRNGEILVSSTSASGYGAGVYIYNASPKFVSCTFTKNSIIATTSGTTAAFGAAIYCNYSQSNFSTCVFKGNKVNKVYDCNGGVIYCSNSSIELSDCNFTKNTAYCNHVGSGLIYCLQSTINGDRIQLTKNTVGASGVNAIIDGVCFYANASTLTLTNLLMANNTSSSDVFGGTYGGLYLLNSTLNLMQATFAKNSDNNGAVFHGASIHYTNGTQLLSVKNSIFYNDNGINEIQGTPSANLTVTYSDIKNGYTGTGNINADPLFFSGNDLHLQPTSPCIKAATLTGAPNDDLESNPRPAPAGTNPDMGSYEMDQSPELSDDNTISNSLQVNSAYPNPVRSFFTIEYSLMHDANVMIDLLDITGRKIKSLSNSIESANDYSFKLNVEHLPSGIYFCRILHDGKIEVMKLIKQ